MHVDPVTTFRCNAADHESEAGIAHIGGPPAPGADDVMVMVGGLAGDVGVIARRQVDPFDGPHDLEDLERSEDRRPPDLEVPGGCIVHQVRSGEVPRAGRDEIGHCATRHRQSVASPIQRGERGIRVGDDGTHRANRIPAGGPRIGGAAGEWQDLY